MSGGSDPIQTGLYLFFFLFLLLLLFHIFSATCFERDTSLSLPYISPLLLTLPLSFTSPLFTIDYRLVIICSNEDEDKSHIISRLNAHRKHFTALHDVGKFREYLKTHFTGATKPTHQSIVTQGVSASMVDCRK